MVRLPYCAASAAFCGVTETTIAEFAVVVSMNVGFLAVDKAAARPDDWACTPTLFGSVTDNVPIGTVPPFCVGIVGTEAAVAPCAAGMRLWELPPPQPARAMAPRTASAAAERRVVKRNITGIPP